MFFFFYTLVYNLTISNKITAGKMDNSTAEAGFYAVAVFIALSENVSAVVVMLVESTLSGRRYYKR